MDADTDWLSRLDRGCTTLGQVIAMASVVIMITLAVLTALDAISRTLTGVSVGGLFELTGFSLAAGILACFPASISQRSHLTIDFVGQLLPAKAKAVFTLIGGVLLLVFLGLLSWRFGIYALAVQARGQTMAAMGIPLAPFFWTASIVLGICVPMQFVVLLVQVRDLAKTADSPQARAPAGKKGLYLLIALIAAALAIGLAPGHFWISAWDYLTHNPPLIGGIFFFLVWVPILLLVPLGAAMGLTGLAGLIMLLGFAPGLDALGFYNARFISSANLAVLPLFVLMGNFAVVAGLADDVYTLANTLLRNWRGGLAQATILGCAGFGALTGSSIATAAAMGAVSLPEMRRRGYSPSLSAGCVAAGGTLGQLVPPSTIIVLYCFLTEVSIGRMFIAVLVPGLITMIAFMAVISLYVRFVPDAAPAALGDKAASLWPAVLRCWGVFLMIVLVIGGMYSGIFTANEAAATGAATSFLFALGRGKLKGRQSWRVMGETAATTAMLFMIIVGAITFSFFMGTTQFADKATEWILAQNLAPLGVVAVLVVLYLLLGTAMESAAIMLITTPIVAPVIQQLGLDLIWWGIIMVVVVEAGIISPPYGLNMFIIQSIQPDISLGDIFRGVMPFFYATLVVIALLILFPSLILWLPSTMMG